MALLIACPTVASAQWSAPALSGSRLALARVDIGDSRDVVLAQRTIEREWGPDIDSLATQVHMEGQRSQSVAMLLSAAVPGAGQAYVDGVPNGIWFFLVEAAAWTTGALLRTSGEQAREDAATYAGVPADSASSWSFARWSAATGEDPAPLETLYSGDPEAFYDLIGNDDRALQGWSGDPAATRSGFVDLRATSDRRLHGARWSESVIWVNHVVSAFDAIRAARKHNQSLGGGVGLELNTGWKRGAPTFSAVLERKF
jgi:hypothetical protein